MSEIALRFKCCSHQFERYMVKKHATALHYYGKRSRAKHRGYLLHMVRALMHSSATYIYPKTHLHQDEQQTEEKIPTHHSATTYSTCRVSTQHLQAGWRPKLLYNTAIHLQGDSCVHARRRTAVKELHSDEKHVGLDVVGAGSRQGVRREERSEPSKPLLFHAASRHTVPRTTGRKTHPHIVSATNPKRLSVGVVTTTPPEASVAEGGSQNAIVRGVCQELPNQVQVARRAWQAERHGSRDEGGQDAYRVVEFPLESLDGDEGDDGRAG